MTDDSFAPDHLEGVEYIIRKRNNDLLGGIIAQQQTRIEELEAKLVKAVEALKYYAEHEILNLYYDDAGFARTTLAELKGQGDE